MKLLIRDKTLYAKSIANILELSEQKVHYHLTMLRKEGLIIPTKVIHIKRGRAKLFKPVSGNFLLSLEKYESDLSVTAFSRLFENFFVSEGQFTAEIVVGSAEPHGKYDAISRDGYLAGDLCLYIGNHLPLQKRTTIHHFVNTDLDYERNRGKYEGNLILIGGHITNTLTSYFNDALKSKFGFFFVENRIVGFEDEYIHPAHGMIARFRNPEKKSSWILILAGVRSLGTRATIYSIISDCCDIFGRGDEFITILKGESQDDIHINGVSGIISKSI
jgi:hypothetical protein